MENMEMMNNVETVEDAVEVIDATTEDSIDFGKVAIGVGVVALAGLMIYKCMIKPAMKKAKSEDAYKDNALDAKKSKIAEKLGFAKAAMGNK